MEGTYFCPVKVCSKCKTEKWIFEFGTREAARDGLLSNCKSCRQVSKDAWRRANPDRSSEYKRRWRERYPEKHRESSSRRAQASRARDPEARRNTERRWRERNPHLVAAKSRRTNARTPLWVCRKAIAAVYREARRLEKLDGQKRHVDHVIPLKGKKVCGLHVAENLQILLASENLRKSNKVLA